ncbi:MAG: site-2 protease family protein [Nannocystaceae bacterium]|nr:site-2 protease family protein [Nannocystaceae bacterium]
MSEPQQPSRGRIGWAWTVGHPFGVRVRVHATFLLLVAWIVASAALGGESIAATIAALVMVATLFTIVVLHELGHALAARRYGIVTRDITLLPIGGVASMERLPEDPRQELVVAFAGPAVNVVLALVFGALALALGLPLSAGPLAPGAAPLGQGMVVQLFWVNVSLAVFNLLPAFPMDGGRVLRALLSLRLGRARATEIAARLGQAMAMALGFVGLFASPVLVFVALFVWAGAQGENEAVHVRELLRGLRVRDVMVESVASVRTDATAGEIAGAIVHGLQDHFPVVDGQGALVGTLGIVELVTAIATRGPEVPVAEIMKPARTATPADALDETLQRMQSEDARAIVVVDRGSVRGLLTLEHLGEFVALEEAMRQRLQQRRALARAA